MSSSTPDFIDELEEIIGSTDKLFVRESQPAIPGIFRYYPGLQVRVNC